MCLCVHERSEDSLTCSLRIFIKDKVYFYTETKVKELSFFSLLNKLFYIESNIIIVEEFIQIVSLD